MLYYNPRLAHQLKTDFQHFSENVVYIKRGDMSVSQVCNIPTAAENDNGDNFASMIDQQPAQLDILFANFLISNYVYF